MMNRPTEISALVHLIDDPDELIFFQVKDKLIEMGAGVIPHLEKAWATENFGDLFQFRLESIIHEIQLKDVFGQLGKWILNPENLLEGVLIVNKYKYPNINLISIEELLVQIVNDIKCQFNDELTILEKIQIINKLLFDIYGFKGDKTNYHDPENSYFNAVLTKKKGNPLMLSILYIEIAKRLGIPISGINLPNHFLVGFLEKGYNQNDSHEIRDSYGVLFYININYNPFRKYLLNNHMYLNHSY